MSMAVTMVIYAVLFFGAGWGWGQWWAERCARRDKSTMDRGRLSVSTPVNPDNASETLRVLSQLMKQAESSAPVADARMCGKCGHPEACAAMGCKTHNSSLNRTLHSWRGYRPPFHSGLPPPHPFRAG